MRADLHVHSSYSNDGVSTPDQIIETAVKLGLGCVAITDHNSFKAYAEVKDNGKIIVIPGIEVSSKEGHILAYGIDRDIPRGRSVKETIDLIHEAGGVAFAAHPYRWWSGLGEKNTLNYDFDGVEAKNGRSTSSGNRKANKLAISIGKPISAGSDAHTTDHIGDGYAEVPDVSTWQEVMAAVMEKKAVAESCNRRAGDTVRYGVKSIVEWIFRGFKKM
ncbi:MAG: CehA/McbA family metallohydrolase [Candidatus Methanoplasma sp.]|jgi:predicted metal-dependent phosphoesterase TrpH|nr:CehA/McbA family metallohydrolase [Candidatus Methanoplasma sp.]